MTTLTREQLRALLIEVGLAHRADEIMAAVRPGINVDRQRVQNEAEIPIGTSKLGGNPDLPPDFVWPMYKGVPLTFLAQFNLAEVKPYDVEDLLPDSGMLYFFHDLHEQPWTQPHQVVGTKVFFVLSQPLVRQIQPDLKYRVAPAYSVHFSTVLTLPDETELARLRLLPMSCNDDDFYKRVKWEENIWKTESQMSLGHLPLPRFQLLGNVDTDDIRGVIYLFDLSVEPTYSQTLLDNACKMRLLFMCSANTLLGEWVVLGFPDGAGKFYWCIHEEDLALLRFDKAWCIAD